MGTNRARMVGYTCQPFCGKACCRETGAGKRKRASETRAAKRRERDAWKREDWS